MGVQAVLFDYGGTLVRHARPWDAVFPRGVRSSYALLKRAGLRITFEEYRETADTAFREQKVLGTKEGRDVPDRVVYREVVDALFPTRSRRWRDAAADRARRAFWATMIKSYALNLHAKAALRRLEAAGVEMAIVSNYNDSEAIDMALKRFGVSRYFGNVFVSSEYGLRKPDPRFFEVCLSAMRLSPDHAVFVGNSPVHDVEGAKGVGMKAILVRGDEPEDQAAEAPRPDFEVSDLLAVPMIVASLG